MDWLGQLMMAASIALLGVLSRRLGSVTKAPPYYLGLLGGAGLLTLSGIIRAVNGLLGVDVDAQSSFWVLVYSGLPALAVTVSLTYAWRYWSWLLAERD